MTPSYRDRLRLEGLVLAGSGAIGSAALLALSSQSKRWPLNTLGQLAVVAVLIARFGPRTARKATEGSVELSAGAEGSGEPTPLWQLPVIVASLTLLVSQPGGWDAGLRVTAGSMLVGLGQAFLIEHAIARDERERKRRYYRIKGSRIGRGTKLGHLTVAG